MRRTLMIVGVLGIAGLSFVAGLLVGRPRGSRQQDPRIPSTAADTRDSALADGAAAFGLATTGRAEPATGDAWPIERAKEKLLEAMGTARVSRRMAALNEVVAHLRTADLDALLTWTEGLPSGTGRNDARARLVGELALSDPEHAVKHAMRGDENERVDVALMAVRSWIEADREGAQRWIEALPPGRLRKQAVADLVQHVSAEDPARALALARAQSPAERGELEAVVIAAWAYQDGEAALDAALELPRGDQRARTLSQVLGSWMQKDPDAAIAWAKENALEEGAPDVLTQLIGSFAYEDPAAAAELALELPQAEGRRSLVANVYMQWAEQDLAGAIASARELEDRALRDEALTSITAWGVRDPSGGAEVIELIESPARRRSATINLARAWAEQDPQAALTWIEALPDERTRDLARDDALAALALQDPRAAATHLDKVSAGTRREAVAATARGWVDRDLPGAQAWAQSLTDPVMREEALAEVVAGYSRIDPAKAAALASGLTGEAKARALSNLTSEWGVRDPAAAAAWVSKLDSADQIYAASMIVGTWHDRDPEAAAQWARGLPPGTLKDQALQSLSSLTMQTDPARALEMSLAVNEQHVRTSLVASLFPLWRDEDPAAAEAWLRASTMSEADKRSLETGAIAGFEMTGEEQGQCPPCLCD